MSMPNNNQQLPSNRPRRTNSNIESKRINLKNSPNQMGNNSRPPIAQQQNHVPVPQTDLVTKKGMRRLVIMASFITFVLAIGAVFLISLMNANMRASENASVLEEQQRLLNASVYSGVLQPAASQIESAVKANANIQVEDSADAKTKGAGIVVSSNGDILTALHVVQNAKKIKVTINNREYDAKVTGTDPTSDIATIKIDANNLDVVNVGDSNETFQGQWCMTVGNPYGMNDTMTAGNISALHRNIKYDANGTKVLYANMIQTDAPINPGSSGGGLYDATGKAIGMVSIINSQSGGSESIGYAIPINYAINIARNLVQGKPAAHATLGVETENVSQAFIDQYGLESTAGAMITNITQAGPADKASITKNDIITVFKGNQVKDSEDLDFQIRATSIGESVDLTVLRNGKTMNFTVTIGSDI